MFFTIAVDANPILAALLGGYARTIIFDPRFCFLTTEFTMAEVKRYLPMVSEKSGVTLDELEYALSILPLAVLKRSIYRASLREAQRRMRQIDPDDVDILALALHAEVPLWTNDLHFTKLKPPIKILRTRDFII